MGDKKYLETHPWINFQLNLKPLPFNTWILLGAAQSKCKHLLGIPIRPEKRGDLLRVSMVKGILSTTAIEGNSLSEDDVRRIVEGKATFPKSKEYQAQEVINVLTVYNGMLDKIKSNISCDITIDQIKSDNKIILEHFEKNDEIIPGEIRHHSVVVGRYRGVPAEDCAYLLDSLCEWLRSDWGFGEDNKVVEAILKAIMAHLYIAWIHPFADGNGRTARALELRILLCAGVPADAAHLLSNHYNDTRSDYYRYLALTSQEQGNPTCFINYAVQGLVDALDGQIKTILEEEVRVTWINYVHSRFGAPLSTAKQRQRDLMLEISDMEEPIDVSTLRRHLSDKLMKQYSDRTLKAFRRDINALTQMKLLKKEEKINHISAAKNLLREYLPISTMRNNLSL